MATAARSATSSQMTFALQATQLRRDFFAVCQSFLKRSETLSRQIQTQSGEAKTAQNHLSGVALRFAKEVTTLSNHIVGNANYSTNTNYTVGLTGEVSILENRISKGQCTSYIRAEYSRIHLQFGRDQVHLEPAVAMSLQTRLAVINQWLSRDESASRCRTYTTIALCIACVAVGYYINQVVPASTLQSCLNTARSWKPYGYSLPYWSL